jgi:hypothetical protein
LRSDMIRSIGVAFSVLLGCANSEVCMRHSDCLADARCIQGACLVPIQPTGIAGSPVKATTSRGGTSSTATAKGGSAATTVSGGAAVGAGTAGSAGQNETMVAAESFAGSAGTR